MLLEVLPYAFSIIVAIISAVAGYLLGLKSQRTQALREYVVDTVQARYPALSSEINKNTCLFGDYLEEPLEHFDFPILDQFYNDGLPEFMKKHHPDLFLSIDYLKQEIAPNLRELRRTVGESIEKIYNKWDSELGRILPREIKGESRNISSDLIRSITSNYVLKDLLNGREDAVKRKIEACILDRTAHIYQEKAKMPFVISGLQTEYVDYDAVFNLLLDSAKPEISRILGLYTNLQKQIDEKVRSELLPLLQKYISNPVQI